MDTIRRFWQLAVAAMERYESERHMASLDEAIDLFSSLVDSPDFAVVDPEYRAIAYNEYALVSMRRYEERGDVTDLNRAIDRWELALKVAPTDAADRSTFLNNLAGALRHREHLDDLPRMVSLCREAFALVPEDDSEGLAGQLHNLGASLWYLSRRTGNSAVLDEAVETCEQVLRLDSRDPVRRGQYRNTLGSCLHTRYHRDGLVSDLERCIELSREAVSLATDGFPERSGYLSNLGTVLRHRYERAGLLADLDEAIAALRQAVHEAPDTWYALPQCLTNLSSVLRARYSLGESQVLLNEAIDAAARAVASVPPQAASFAGYANNFVQLMGIRIDAGSGDHDEFCELVDGMATTLAEAGNTGMDRPLFEANLAMAYHRRYTVRRKRSDLRRALRLAHSACDGTDPDTPQIVSRLLIKARLLQLRSEATGRTADRAAAIDTFGELCSKGLDLAPENALGGATIWADWAVRRKSWEEATRAFTIASQAIRRLFSAQVFREDKETWLRLTSELPARSAHAHVRGEDLHGAVMALEGGRALMLTEALDLARTDLSALARNGRPELAERFRAAAERIGQLTREQADVPTFG